jgi:hypothetical protein
MVRIWPNKRAIIHGSFCACAILVMLGAPRHALADVFDLTWTGAYGPGSATLNATPIGGNAYEVTSLSGTQNGSSISLLAPGAYGGNDNEIFVPGTPDQLDFPGFGFTDGTFDYNLFAYTLPGDTNTYTECRSDVATVCSGGDVNNGIAVATLSITPAVSSVPEPGSVILLITVAIGAAVLQRRRSTPVA